MTQVPQTESLPGIAKFGWQRLVWCWHAEMRCWLTQILRSVIPDRAAFPAANTETVVWAVRVSIAVGLPTPPNYLDRGRTVSWACVGDSSLRLSVVGGRAPKAEHQQSDHSHRLHSARQRALGPENLCALRRTAPERRRAASSNRIANSEAA